MKFQLAKVSKCKSGYPCIARQQLSASRCKSHETTRFTFRKTISQHERSNHLTCNFALFSSKLFGLRSHSTHNNEKEKDQQHEYRKNERTILKNDSHQQLGNNLSAKNRSVGLFLLAIILAFIGLTYASVPLYRLFCQTMGFGGTVKENSDKTVSSLAKRRTKENLRSITVSFNSDVSPKLPWKFRPTQTEVTVAPGESVLAFYSAINTSDKPITGISTYNVTPHKAGSYFNKIQCFCFEQQRLEPHEQVELPVFFYIDPSILDDPNMADVTNITLSYTFFKSDD